MLPQKEMYFITEPLKKHALESAHFNNLAQGHDNACRHPVIQLLYLYFHICKTRFTNHYVK